MLITLYFWTFYAKAQQTGLHKLTARLDTLRSHLPIEKPYITTDKPYYSSGDTLWFKAYIFNADFLSGSQRSGLLYLELTNDSGFVAKRVLLAIQDGLGAGQIALDKPEIRPGSYTSGPIPTGYEILVRIMYLKRIFI